MKQSKKGSLNLSINAIVILILAITMLGLGLAFMRNIFGSATKEFEEVGGTVKKQMIDQMKQTTKIVDISSPKLKMKPGEKKQVFLGFKNEGTGVLDFQIRQIDATRLGSSDTNTFDIDVSTDLVSLAASTTGLCGVKLATGESPGTIEAYIEYKNTKTTVGKGDVVVVPMNIHSKSNANQGTCVYELKIDTNADPANPETPDYNAVIELSVDVSN